MHQRATLYLSATSTYLSRPCLSHLFARTNRCSSGAPPPFPSRASSPGTARHMRAPAVTRAARAASGNAAALAAPPTAPIACAAMLGPDGAGRDLRVGGGLGDGGRGTGVMGVGMVGAELRDSASRGGFTGCTGDGAPVRSEVLPLWSGLPAFLRNRQRSSCRCMSGRQRTPAYTGDSHPDAPISTRPVPVLLERFPQSGAGMGPPIHRDRTACEGGAGSAFDGAGRGGTL